MDDGNLKSWHAPVIMAGMTLLRMGLLLVWLAMPDLCLAAGQTKPPSPYFAIHVVDAGTSRGVPMVELQTTSSVCYYTDSKTITEYSREVWPRVILSHCLLEEDSDRQALLDILDLDPENAEARHH